MKFVDTPAILIILLLGISNGAEAPQEPPESVLLETLDTQAEQAGSRRCKLAPDGSMVEYCMEFAGRMEVGFDSDIAKGTGYDHIKGHWKANPFVYDKNTPILKQVAREETKQTKQIITSSKEYGSSMRALAKVSGSGYGVKAKASASYDGSQKFSSKDVIFTLSSETRFGFHGWERAPAFSKAAKSIVCSNGLFFKTYGTYYVAGQNNGNGLNVFIQATTKTSSSDQKVSAEIEASYQGLGGSAAASASFGKTVSKSGGLSNIKARARTYGVNANSGYSVDLDITKLDVTLKHFAHFSTQGAGISLLLRRYADHPDYIAEAQKCPGKVQGKKGLDEETKDKLADLAVMLQIAIDNINDHKDKPTQCAIGLQNDLVDKLNEVYKIGDRPAGGLGLKEYSALKRGIIDQIAKWDADDNTCKSSVHPQEIAGQTKKSIFKTGLPCDSNYDSHSVRFVDINGDGLDDIICQNGYSKYAAFATGHPQKWKKIGKILGTWCGSYSKSGFNNRIEYKDLNGDGKVDAVCFSGSQNSQVYQARMGKGDGTFKPQGMVLGKADWNIQHFPKISRSGIRSNVHKSPRYYGFEYQELILANEVEKKLDSKIFTQHMDQILFGALVDQQAGKTLQLIFRGSRDGYSMTDMHNHIDNKGATISVFKTTRGDVWGAYTNIPWKYTGRTDVRKDRKTFMWKFDPAKRSFEKFGFDGYRSNTEVIYHRDVVMWLDFGFLMRPDCNTNTRSNIDMQNYRLPWHVDRSAAKRYANGGHEYFQCAEVEVFQVL